MGNVLSKEELAALKSAFSEKAVEEEGAEKKELHRQARPYDFSSGAMLSARPRALVHALHDRMARRLGRMLGQLLNVRAEACVAQLEAVTFGVCEDKLRNDGVLVTLQLEAFKSRVLLAIHPILAFSILDLMTGGCGEAPAPERPPTEIEFEVLEEAIGQIAGEFQTSFRQIKETQVTIEERVANKQLLRFVPVDEPVIAVTIEIKLKEVSGLLTICYARQIVEQINEMAASEAPKVTPDRLEQLTPECLQHVPLEGQVLLQPVLLALREVIMLQAGDVLLLDHAVDQPLTLRIGDRAFCSGYLGHHGDRLAYAIAKRC